MMILMTSSENNSSGVFIIDLITGEFFIYALDIDKDIVMDLKYENSDWHAIHIIIIIDFIYN